MALQFPDTTTAGPLSWGLTLTQTFLILFVMSVIEGGTILIVDPWQQLASTRNAERMNDVNEIANAFYMDFADHRGTFSCASGPVPIELSWIQSSGGYNLAPCLVPDYLVQFPHDPGDAGAYYRSVKDYWSGYRIMLNIATMRLVVTAPSAELGATIQVER
ncbi:MAG: hypothetical protein Q7S84_02480 [bacterium]|nr:hypothetical protein [bacterium]